MEILDRHSEQMQQDLYEWALEHAAEYPDKLVALEPGSNEHQKMLVHTVKSEPLPSELISSIATGIDDRYPEIDSAINANTKALRIGGAILKSRQNLFLGMDHNEFIDIALVQASATANLRKAGCEFDSNLIVSKMVASLGVIIDGKVVPATEVLGYAFDEVYLTLPRSISSESKMTIPEKAVKAYNSLVVTHGIEKRLKASSKLGKAVMLGAALPGTVNKRLDAEKYAEKQQDINIEIPKDVRDKTVVVGHASSGVTRFMDHALTMLASAQLAPGNIRVRMSDEPVHISAAEELTAGMETIAGFQNSYDPDHFYVYDRDNNLPVIRK